MTKTDQKFIRPNTLLKIIWKIGNIIINQRKSLRDTARSAYENEPEGLRLPTQLASVNEVLEKLVQVTTETPRPHKCGSCTQDGHA